MNYLAIILLSVSLLAERSSAACTATLKHGSRGDCVRVVQRVVGTAVDGIFGPKTEAAVRACQTAAGIASDGIVGPNTWKVINSGRCGPVTTKRLSDCLQCICNVESGCRSLGCAWDVNSPSCGYFQIKLDYYIDCGMPGRRSGESSVVAWTRCGADLDCASSCVQAYYKRYKGNCATASCESMARLHNGGPNGCRKTATDKYWNRVMQCLP